MRIFLAGATGAIGRRLTPLLLAAGHEVTGSTRSPETARELNATGMHGVVVDVFDAAALRDAVVKSRPEIIIHQLTDLPRVVEDEAQLAASYPRNARIVVHDDNWRWGPREHYTFREHEGRGYWRGGRWVGW